MAKLRCSPGRVLEAVVDAVARDDRERLPRLKLALVEVEDLAACLRSVIEREEAEREAEGKN